MVICFQARTGCFVARVVFRIALACVCLAAFLGPEGDRLHLTQTEEIASRHTFNLVGWEVGNLTDKWTHRLTSILSGQMSKDEEFKQLERYFEASMLIRDVQRNYEIDMAKKTMDAGASFDLEKKLAHLKNYRRSLRNDVEEVLESVISRAIQDQDISSIAEFVLPPVDFRLESPPKILVTSRRDRIERLESVLIDMSTTTTDSEKIERIIGEEQNLSAIVLELGGLATYPTFVDESTDLYQILELAAHEWLHAHFFFYPFGKNIESSDEMRTLNETIANIVGKELGVVALGLMAEPQVFQEAVSSSEMSMNTLDFSKHMRDTRAVVDELLQAGRVEEAEVHMETRRLELLENGFFIRKINQAYFAFRGTYADTPFSVSPIGPEVEELMLLMPDLGEFVRTVRGISNYSEFRSLLERTRLSASGRY